MKELLLIGAGGHAKSCIDVIESKGLYKISGFVDKNIEKKNTIENGYPVLGKDEDLLSLREKYQNAFITLGQIKSPLIRINLYNHLKDLNYNLPIIFSSLSYVSKNAKVLEGTIVMHFSIVNAGATVGKNCIINNKALVEHGAIIADNCHVSTGAIINGEVNIGGGTFIGSGAVVKNKIKIGNNCVVGAGCVIKKDIPDNQIIFK